MYLFVISSKCNCSYATFLTSGRRGHDDPGHHGDLAPDAGRPRCAAPGRRDAGDRSSFWSTTSCISWIYLHSEYVDPLYLAIFQFCMFRQLAGSWVTNTKPQSVKDTEDISTLCSFGIREYLRAPGRLRSRPHTLHLEAVGTPWEADPWWSGTEQTPSQKAVADRAWCDSFDTLYSSADF